MKKVFFCLVLVLSILLFFACASAPAAPKSASTASSATDTPAPSTPAATPQQTTNTPTSASASASGNNDIILSGSETYTVVWGDTLTKIARKKYGNGFYYPLILMASSNVVKDQDRIIPGMKLTIPRLQANLDDSRARAGMKRFFLETASITERKRPRDAAGLRNLANSL
jgi:nucleoid-associated protein YgaU